MSKSYSTTDVEQHNKDKDAWIIIDDGVYDISKFAALHPGGKGVIMSVAGQNASEQFWQFHNKQILKKYQKLRVGSVGGSGSDSGEKNEEPAKPAKSDSKPSPPPSKSTSSSSSGSTSMVHSNNAKENMFGDQVPYGDATWCQGWNTPYYGESHRKWRAALREFVDNELTPYAHQWDEAKEVPLEVRRRIAELGFLPAAVAAGGKGCWPTEYTDITPGNGLVSAEEFDGFHQDVFWQELCRCGAAGVVWGLTTGLAIGLPPFLHFGKEEVRQKVIPDILAGKKFICLAITEPSTGSDTASLTTSAKKTEDGKHYIVNGVKKWITNGHWSDYFTTAVRTGGKGAGGVSMLLIPRVPGVSTQHMKCQGAWGSGTGYVTFENAKVPVENLIGKENAGFKVMMYNFNYERLRNASCACRFSRVLLEESMQYAFKRKTFGKRLIDHPVIRLKLAHMARQVEATHNWLENVVYQTTIMDRTQVNSQMAGPIALLKAQCSTVMEFCAREASQIFGGLSYTRGGQGEKVERLYREVRAFAIPAGSEEILYDLSIRQAMKQYEGRQKK